MNKIIFIGIDGMNPKLTESMMDAGKLPNFARLRETGCYRRLETVNPPQSPVVWAPIATGCNPGEHGVFDFIHRNSQAGQEMRDVHPFLVISPRNFNNTTSLVIGLPMTTVEYNTDNPFAVAIGQAKGRSETGKTSYELCHQPKSFDWRVRGAMTHPLKRLPDVPFADVCRRLDQIIQVG